MTIKNYAATLHRIALTVSQFLDRLMQKKNGWPQVQKNGTRRM